MAKYTRRKRKLSFTSKSFIFLTIAFFSWLFVSVFAGSINTRLTMDIQKMSSEVTLLRNENQHLTVEIQTLQNKDRIFTIAKDAGLNQNQDNVLTINTGD